MTSATDRELLDGAWFTTEELANLLGVDGSTLRRWRTARPPQGPPFVHLSGGITRYHERDIARWLLDRRTDPSWAA
jgi:predicted DNA-binding transcriptional regulator AlpA